MADPADDKELADALNVLAEVIGRLNAAKPATDDLPVIELDLDVKPASAPSVGSPTAEQTSLARTILAAVLTGLPQVLARGLIGKQVPTDPAERAAALKDIRNRNRRAAEDRALGGGGGAVGAASAIGQMVAARFAVALGPLAVFSQALQAGNSGMSVFNKGMQVLGATLAPIILPVAVVLAAALVELSDDLNGKLGPAITEWTRLIISTTPALLKFAQALAQATDFFVNKLPAQESVQDAVFSRREAAKAIDAGKTREQYQKEVEDSWTARQLRSVGAFDRANTIIARRMAAFDEVKADPTLVAHAPDGSVRPGALGEGFKGGIPLPRDVNADPNAPDSQLSSKDFAAKNAIREGITRDQFGQNVAAAAQRQKVPPELIPDMVKSWLDAFDKMEKEMRGAAATISDHATAAAAAVKAGATREQFQKQIEESPEWLGLQLGNRKAGDEYLRQRLGAYDELKGAAAKVPAAGGGPFTSVFDRFKVGGVGAAEPAGTPRAGGTTGRDALQDVVRSLRLSLTPTASIGSLQGVGNQVQLKALQSDPLDQRMLDISIKSVERLEGIISEMKGLRSDLATPAKRGPAAPPFTTDGTKPK